jgi:hypothetical protein
MPIAETPIASAASEPTTVLFNEALICISSFQAAGRNGVAHIHTSKLKSDVPSINIEAEQGFFKPKLWRNGPDQRLIDDFIAQRRGPRAIMTTGRVHDRGEAASEEPDGVNEKAPPERGLS